MIEYRDGEIVLQGVCVIEELETLLQLLESYPDADLRLTQCEHLHTGILQALLCSRVTLKGDVHAPFIWQWVAPLLRRTRSPERTPGVS